MQIDIYSDIVCPWCYLGERRLMRALQRVPHEDEIELRFRPYQLDPGAPTPAVPLTAYLQRRFGAMAGGMMTQVGAAAAAEGITIDWDRALAANTRLAHRLLILAGREYGGDAQRRLAERLFALHFSAGEDVGAIDTLTQAAADEGLDAAVVRAYLASGEGEREFDAALDEARRLGIRAVPTFVIDGRFAVQGAQSPAALAHVLAEARRAAAVPPA